MKRGKIFSWLAYNNEGLAQRGELLALNKAHAKVLLEAKNLVVRSLSRKFKINFKPEKIAEKQMMFFYRQLATLLNAGIAILPCFDLLENNSTLTPMHTLICQIKHSLLMGLSLSAAFNKHPIYFEASDCHLIYVGEKTGKLDEMLNKIADNKEKYFQLKKNILQSLLYPCFIFTSAICMFIFMLIFVVPKFSELFANTTEQLPRLTLFVMHLSGFLQQYWPFIFILAITMLFILLHSKNKILDTLIKLPMTAPLIQKIYLIKFNGLLKIMLSAGMNIQDGLALLHLTSAPQSYLDAVRSVQLQINAGQRLYKALGQNVYFPKLMVQMIQVGEESGSLELMLEKLSQIYKDELETWLQVFKQLLEPLIIIFLGALIGGIVIAMYLPIFKLGMIT